MRDTIKTIKRFKTEAEFIAAYGLDFHENDSLGPSYWVAGMDYLYGQEFTMANKGRWMFSPYMFVEEPMTDEVWAKYGPMYEEKDRIAKLKDQFKPYINITNTNDKNTINIFYNVLIKPIPDILAGSINFFIYRAPTGNCQLQSICQFESVLRNLKNPEQVKVIFQILDNIMPMKLLNHFDVHQSDEMYITPLKPMGVIKYTSTNGSLMMTGIINFNNNTNV